MTYLPCPHPGCDGRLVEAADRTWRCRHCGHVLIRPETEEAS
jgi:hypothetical protein